MKEILSQSLFVPLRCYAACLFLITILFTGAVVAESPERGEIRTPMWGSTGHHIINLKAAMHLPNSMAALKADSNFFYTHASDADNRKDTSGTSFFAESPRHFIDIDIYPNYHNLSHDLNTVISQYGSSFVRSNGTLPWAVVMVFDSLVAQLKRHDTTDAIQTMADLGHYIGDAHQPLHCTNNYDGASTNNNGIHSRYETNMVNSNQSSLTITQDSAEYIASPIDYIFDIIYHSNSLVDSIMSADNYAKTASGWSGGSFSTAYYTALWQKCGGFTKDQFQRATVALASFWYTASVKAQSNYQITASSGTNGSIIPSGILAVSEGGSQRFTFSPTSGYHVDSVIVDGAKIDSLAGYTFTNVTAPHTVYVSFAVNLSSYTITASAGNNGTIAPSGAVSVNFAENQRFTFNPSIGYHVDSVMVDGIKVDSVAGYTFNTVMATHTISVNYALNSYTINAASGGHGTIVPSGAIVRSYGDNQRFTFNPSTGYHVDSVLVDGAKVDSTEGYTFSGIDSGHTITIKYALNTYIIATIPGLGGTIAPTPSVTVNYGASQIINVTPDPGYQIDSILVDESYVGNTSPDTLKNVTSAHTVRCVFGISQITTVHIIVADRWNLVSVPMRVNDYTKTVLYPAASSDAFAYQGIYNPTVTLTNGIGYWMKFSGTQDVAITGYPVLGDTVYLAAGWNIIGALSEPARASDITTDTPGLTLSQLYGYRNGYIPADSLHPGFGYWVKASSIGRIILTAIPGISPANKVRFVRISELPPPPPGQSFGNEIPAAFQLEQNYPNPFNPGTVIQYQLPADAYVSLKVYNTLGQEVAALVDGEQTAGYKSVKFESAKLPSGVYIYKIIAGSYSETRKMILMK